MHHRALAITGVLVAAIDAVAVAQSTVRASVDSSGTQANDFSALEAHLSADGRFAAFTSRATNLVTPDHNRHDDVFVHDFFSGATERASLNTAGRGPNGYSTAFGISADARYVLFMSAASDLVANDTNGLNDMFVRDRTSGTNERVSVDPSGGDANGSSYGGAISADGRFVAFVSGASNLVANDTNNAGDIFVYDRATATTERVSVDSAGGQADDSSQEPSISADGRFVAFSSDATNLVANDTNGTSDVFVRDRQAGTTQLVSVDPSGNPGDDMSFRSGLSADGRYAAFTSSASNLVPGDVNYTSDVFVRDLANQTTEIASVDSTGKQADGFSVGAALSADGRYVAFMSDAKHLVPGDTNGFHDVFVHDRQTGSTVRTSVDSAGHEGDADSPKFGFEATISPDGLCSAFVGHADNLVAGDTNGVLDVFVHGPWLTLEADPAAPPAGATLTFSNWTGMANRAVLLVVTDVNGAPTFVPEVLDKFDAAGAWTLSATVPPGLSGNVVTFRTLGIVPTGKLDLSNEAVVAFQ